MWDRYTLGNEVFDAGIDHTLAAAKERKRLEQEATNFNLWHGTDFLPEEDPDHGELLLDELEQDDILSELLRNARKYIIPGVVFIRFHAYHVLDRLEYACCDRRTY
jgi:hypothetical protein